MKKTSVGEFENKRWKGGSQRLVFRHTEAMSMVEKGEKVLDIGCGDGLLLQALSQKGAIVSGMDISEEGVRQCREKGFDASLFDVSTESLPFADKTFDTVIILDVLEHVYEPELLLKEAARVSKKHIVISVPNFNSLPARLQVLFGKVPENNLPHKGHLYWFNYSVLESLLRRRNLRLEKMSCNTFWENTLLGKITKPLCRFFPSLFALSFVVKVSVE